MSRPIIARPILHTDRAEEYLTILRALGMQVLEHSPGWTLLQGGGGRLALHPTYPGRAEGEVALGFETDDLDAFVTALGARAPQGLRFGLVDADHGRAIEVVGRDGLRFTVDTHREYADPVDPPAPHLAQVVVHPLWISPDVVAAAEDLEALGCRRRQTERNGHTIDLDATSGRVLVHVAEGEAVGAVVQIDCDDDIDRAHTALLAAGVRHDVIDETHGRTLKVPMPGTDQLLWVAQEDEDPVGVIRH